MSFQHDCHVGGGDSGSFGGAASKERGGSAVSEGQSVNAEAYVGITVFARDRDGSPLVVLPMGLDRNVFVLRGLR